MKQTSRRLFLFFILTVLTACAVGCQKKTVTCPFTTITWDNTFDDITELEGDSIDTYDSVYDGTTYTFPKEYDGLDGTIKYMFDDEEKLVCMSWMYETSNSEDLADVYNKIHGEAEDILGESGFDIRFCIPMFPKRSLRNRKPGAALKSWCGLISDYFKAALEPVPSDSISFI